MRTLALFLLIVVALVSGCGQKPDEDTSSNNSVLITVTHPVKAISEVTEHTVGTLKSTQEPLIAAQVAAPIKKLLVKPGDTVKKGQCLALLDATDLGLAQKTQLAQVTRLKALYDNQISTTKRYRELLANNYISRSTLEEAIASEVALKEEWRAAKAQLSLTKRQVEKTNILSPIDGRIESRLVSKGEYVSVGTPLFQVVSTKFLRAHLPFPENVAHRLEPGQKVHLTTPTSPNEIVEGVIREIKPKTARSGLLMAIVDLPKNTNWKPGSSVHAKVITALRDDTVIVPEQSIVLRPKGKVVYVIRKGKAIQTQIATGVTHVGAIEILSDLSPEEPIAVDGAGFLTDGAHVNIVNG